MSTFRRNLLDDDRQTEAEVNLLLATIGAYLRQALDDVEAVARSEHTPLTKLDYVGQVLEDLGDHLERCVESS